jgi:hypothetical protein
MISRFLPRPVGRSLRSRIEAAELGIVPTLPELEAAPAAPAETAAPLMVSHEYIAALQQALAAAEQQRDAACAELERLEHEHGEPACAQDEAESDSVGETPQQVMARQVLRIEELEREYIAMQDALGHARGNFEAHLERCTAKRAAGGDLDLVGSLQTGNQRLRADLRTVTDRATRAEARVAGLELTVQTLAQAHTGQERPRVVVVDGEEIVVPWGSRA